MTTTEKINWRELRLVDAHGDGTENYAEDCMEQIALWQVAGELPDWYIYHNNQELPEDAKIDWTGWDQLWRADRGKCVRCGVECIAGVDEVPKGLVAAGVPVWYYDDATGESVHNTEGRLMCLKCCDEKVQR